MEQPATDRRSLLTGGAAALATLPLAGGRAISATDQIKALPKVDVAANRITRKIAGLRPFRPSGFVVRHEQLGDKSVIHNYGHGGCGVTLSWGTADMAAALALATPHRRAAVIGCGAVGLATARLLQDRGFEVVIYAKDVPPNTTSDVAAALFGVTSLVDNAHRSGTIVGRDPAGRALRPSLLSEPDRRALRRASDRVLHDRRRAAGAAVGVRHHPGAFSAHRQRAGQESVWNAPREQLSDHAHRDQHLPAANACRRPAARRQARGAHFPDRSALAALPEPLIVNCTGLGAKALFDDRELTPVKGQLTLLLPQADVDYAYLDAAKDLYMFPRRDAVFLGGSHQEGDWSTAPDEALATRIFDGHKAIAAAMR